MTGNLGEVPQISAARENCLPKRFYAISWQSNSQNTGYVGLRVGLSGAGQITNVLKDGKTQHSDARWVTVALRKFKR
jgi:hypothetical protein